MKKFLMLIIMFFPVFVFAEKTVWKIVEKQEMSGVKVVKTSYFNEKSMKLIKESDGKKIAHVIDLQKEQIVLLDYNSKEYQTVDLNKYIKMASDMASAYESQGYLNKSKADRDIEYIKGETEKSENGELVQYTVMVDGKKHQDLWIDVSMKNSPVLLFREKFRDYLPASLMKYRSLESKIRDNFTGKGMIMKAVSHPPDEKLSTVTRKIDSVKPIPFSADIFTVPEDFAEGVPARRVKPVIKKESNEKAQEKETPSKKESDKE